MHENSNERPQQHRRIDGVTMPWNEPALATAGHIKIGGLGEARKKRNAKGPEDTFRMPVKYDHFLITKTMRNGDGDLLPDMALMSDLEDQYGTVDPRTGEVKLLQIPIVLHSDNLNEVFPCNLALYQGKRLFCSGDGTVATRYKRDGDGKVLQTKTLDCPCQYSSLVDADRGKCKPHATLHCSIRMKGHGLFGSVYRWRTTSAISIRRMIGSLQQVLDLVGSLRGVPLMLVLSEVQLAGKAPVWCCHVELRELELSDAQRLVLQMAAQRQQVAAASAGQPVRLKVLQPGGDHEDEAEQSAIAEEFHPSFDDDDGIGDGDEDAPPSIIPPPRPAVADMPAEPGGDTREMFGDTPPEPEPKGKRGK